MIAADPAVNGMSTTLTALFWSEGRAAVCHIGDSRGYLLRGGELYQFTRDHTLVQSLVDEGRITPAMPPPNLSARCSSVRSTAGRSPSRTSPNSRAKRETVTCSALTGFPTWSATRPCGRR